MHVAPEPHPTTPTSRPPVDDGIIKAGGVAVAHQRKAEDRRSQQLRVAPRFPRRVALANVNLVSLPPVVVACRQHLAGKQQGTSNSAHVCLRPKLHWQHCMLACKKPNPRRSVLTAVVVQELSCASAVRWVVVLAHSKQESRRQGRWKQARSIIILMGSAQGIRPPTAACAPEFCP